MIMMNSNTAYYRPIRDRVPSTANVIGRIVIYMHIISAVFVRRRHSRKRLRQRRDYCTRSTLFIAEVNDPCNVISAIACREVEM